jgi:hypothetical protein
MLPSDEVLHISVATGPCTLVLLTPSDYAGRTLFVKVTGTTGPGAELQIDPGADTIDGSSSTIVGITALWTCYQLHSDGTGWFIHSLYP